MGRFETEQKCYESLDSFLNSLRRAIVLLDKARLPYPEPIRRVLRKSSESDNYPVDEWNAGLQNPGHPYS